MDTRTRRGLVPAFLGVVLGTIGVVADAPLLGLVAGVCGLLVLLVTVRAGAPGATVATVAPPVAPEDPEAPSASPEPGHAAARAEDGRLSTVGDIDPGPATPEPVPAPVAPSAGGLQAAREGGSSLVDAHGLFSQEYFLMAVETRVSAARRHLRPVAVVLFEVGTHDEGGERAAPALVATAIRATLREADTACRLAGDRYAFVLEDTPEDGALWTMERFRRVLQAAEPEAVRWAGIACYPAHAFSADGVLTKAEQALVDAKEWGQDRVEVASAD